MKGEFTTVETVFKNGVPFIRFLGRTENKEKLDITVKGILPYFFILTDEENKITFDCKKERGYKSIFGETLTKIIVTNPFDIKRYIVNFSKTFEADLKYPIRNLIDSNVYTAIDTDGKTFSPITLEIEPRIMLLDIETEYYGGSNYEMDKAITAISFHDNYTNKLYTISYHPDLPNSISYEEKQSDILFEKDKSNTILKIEKHIVKDEYELLKLFKKFVIDFDIDIFTGWNINFDMIYILRRLEMLSLVPSDLSPLKKYYYATEKLSSDQNAKSVQRKEKTVIIKGRAIIDMLKGYRRLKWKQVSSYKLDEIGKNEFGIGKITYEGWIGNFWKNNFNEFLTYNQRDIEICLAINNQYSIIDFLLNMRRITGCDLSDVHFNSRMIDIYILRKCVGKYILPTKVFSNNFVKEKIEGGFVLSPKVGLFKNIAVLDMKSLYPSIMLSLNMSPDTISDNGTIICGNGVKFKQETGVLKEILVDMLTKRDDIRKMLKDPKINSDKREYLRLYKYQYAYKTFTNSLYGVTLFPSFRLFDNRVGASITYTGRYLSHKIEEYCKSKGYDVIRQDTDSVFIDFKQTSRELIIEKAKEIEKEINEHFVEWFKGWNNDVSYFAIKFEKLYESLYSGKEKKLYGGKIIWDWEKGILDVPEIEVKGFAAKRSDRSLFSRNLQKHVFEMIFDNKSKSDIVSYIYEEIDKFFARVYDYEIIGIPKAITKDLEEYATDNPWVRGVKYSQNNIAGYTFSPKPYLLYIKSDNKYKTDVICFDNSNQVPSDININFDRMLECSVFNILKKILPIINIDNNLISNYIKNKINFQSSLLSY